MRGGEKMSNLIHRVKAGGIVLSVWENEAIVNGKEVTIPNITISRVYLDKKSNNWKYTANFRETDMDNIKKAIDGYKNEDYEENFNNDSNED